MIEKKIYELTASNDKKFVVGICKKSIVNDMYEMKIWDGTTMNETSSLFVCVDLGGSRYAISNDGQYVATAQCEDYEDGTIYVYMVESGKNIFRNQSLKRIQWVMFEDNKTLMVGTEDSGIFIFDIISGVCKNKIKAKKVYFNKFGDNILLLNKNKIRYGKYTFKSSTFAYLCAIGTPNGILVSEVNGDLFYYGNDGILRWKTDCLDLGHVISIYYDEKRNRVYGILLNPRKKGEDRMHLIVLSEVSGDIIVVNSIETANYVFVENSKAVSLVNGTGGIYTFNDDCLERTKFIT
ncbi:MAG: hypothetical protein J6C01_06095 [Lachnospiraceae bacterium]|nr:hypothetical protein [Lachnospiraceae bacterium]